MAFGKTNGPDPAKQKGRLEGKRQHDTLEPAFSHGGNMASILVA